MKKITIKPILMLLLAISTISLIGCNYHPHYHDRDHSRYEKRTSGHEHGDRNHRDDGHQKDRSH